MPSSFASAAWPPALSAAVEIAFMTSPQDQLTVDIIYQLTFDQAACQHQPMVDTQEIRDAFAARLNRALDDVEGVRKARGRNVDFHALMKSKAPGFDASTQATHKWLKAESMPEKDNMRMIAAVTEVRAEWLEYGEGPMRPGETREHESKESNVVAADFSRNRADMVDIPRLDVAGSM